jgi:hypothetical protein
MRPVSEPTPHRVSNVKMPPNVFVFHTVRSPNMRRTETTIRRVGHKLRTKSSALPFAKRLVCEDIKSIELGKRFFRWWFKWAERR